MKKESIRIPGKAPFVFVATVSGMIILTFMVLAVIYLLRGGFLTAAALVGTSALLVCYIRSEIRMNGDYYLMDDRGIQVIRDWKEVSQIPWEEITGLATTYAVYRGKERLHYELCAKKMQGDVCVEDKRITFPLPLSPYKQAQINKYVRHLYREMKVKGESRPHSLNR